MASSTRTLESRRRREPKNGSTMAYLLVAPAALFVFLFLIVPIFYAFWCSLWRCDYMNFSKFLGLQNYLEVLTNKSFIRSFLLTMGVSLASYLISLVLGVLYAVWLDKLSKTTAYVLELILLIPWVTSMVVSALLWQWLFQDSLGLVNFLLNKVGLSSIKFLSSKNVVVWTLVFVLSWRLIAYAMIQVLAGLKAIPKDYEEAAMIDGANRFQMFWRVKIPMLKTPIALSSMIILLSNINNVVVPRTLTGGGPGEATMVLGIKLYNESFMYYHFGESSAMSIVLCLINFIFIYFYIKAIKHEIK